MSFVVQAFVIVNMPHEPKWPTTFGCLNYFHSEHKSCNNLHPTKNRDCQILSMIFLAFPEGTHLNFIWDINENRLTQKPDWQSLNPVHNHVCMCSPKVRCTRVQHASCIISGGQKLPKHTKPQTLCTNVRYIFSHVAFLSLSRIQLETGI